MLFILLDKMNSGYIKIISGLNSKVGKIKLIYILKQHAIVCMSQKEIKDQTDIIFLIHKIYNILILF